MSQPSPTLRYVQLGVALVGLIAVMIFAPRTEAPRIVCGMALKTKGGGPGLSNLGFLLLVVVPAAGYLVTGFVGRTLLARRDGD